MTPATFAAGYVVPLALAANVAGVTVRYMPGPLPGEIPDDGDRWIFSGIGTYRMIKRRAAAMRAAMPPEESAALLVEGAALEAAVDRYFEPGSFRRAMHAMAREREASR